MKSVTKKKPVKKITRTTTKGYIYVLKNPVLSENWVKVGKTSRKGDIFDMVRDAPNLPLKYEVAKMTEKLSDVAEVFDEYLSRLGKGVGDGFYKISPNEAKKVLQEVLDARTKLPIKNSSSHQPTKKGIFTKLSIPRGSKIVYLRDPSIVATVETGRHVLWNDRVFTITGLAQELLYRSACRGPTYFSYKGQILADMLDIWRHGAKRGRKKTDAPKTSAKKTAKRRAKAKSKAKS